jgi:AbiTii
MVARAGKPPTRSAPPLLIRLLVSKFGKNPCLYVQHRITSSIQDEVIDGNSDLATVLRKLLVVASRLGNEPVKTWTEMELDGYPESSELPDYRILHGLESLGIFSGAMGYQLRNAPLSLLGLPEAVRQGYSDPDVRQGVRSIAEMIRSEQEGTVSWAWPAEACQYFDLKGYREDLRLMQAWIAVPVAALIGLLDTIRNKALNFALEMEEQLAPESESETSSDQSGNNRQIGFH